MFRHTTTVAGDGPDAGSSNDSAHSKDDGLCSTVHYLAQFEQTDLAEAILSSVGDVRASELAYLIEALVVNDGNGARAAQQIGLSPTSFYSKLHTLGLSIKDLTTRLSTLRDERAARRTKEQ